MHIVGTAGHVDHGKSSLVAALTGTNPDRWIEEQLRGMTLDLGFAHLRFGDEIEGGIVDVPGHERFLHNMLAGAAGMELLLLVIAADEGIMPQTVEHLQILRYLNVRDVIVVLTKMDLLPPDEGGTVCRRIHAELAGTIAADAPIFAVSTVTGENLDALREGIRSSLASLPLREPAAPAFLPIDRVFTRAGHGTIVTGTLMQGTIALNETLKLEPSGKKVRVRGLQTFGQVLARASGGARVAVNLGGVDAREIARGEVLAAAQFAPSARFGVRFEPLPQARVLLHRRTPVRAHIGAAEILGTLVFERPPSADDEGALEATLFLRRPTVAYPGMPLVLRRLSPKTLLGGARIGNARSEESAPPEDGSDARAQAVREVLASRGFAPMSMASIATHVNVREDVVEEALGALVARGDVLPLRRPAAYMGAVAAEAFLRGVLEELETLHRAEPWAMGATSIALARRFGVDEALLVRVLEAYALEGRLAHRAGYFATVGHVPQLSEQQRRFFENAVALDPKAPFVPAPLAGVLAQMKSSSIAGVAKAYDTMVARGALVKVGDDVYRGTQIAQIHARVRDLLAREGRMTMAQFRDMLGTSRKYAVPLLEWFDARGITVRSGDYRMLRASKGTGE